MEVVNLLQFAERGELRQWLMENHAVERCCWVVTYRAKRPDGNGFKATFEHFKIKHLPDQRRLEWLEKNKE